MMIFVVYTCSASDLPASTPSKSAVYVYFCTCTSKLDGGRLSRLIFLVGDPKRFSHGTASAKVKISQKWVYSLTITFADVKD